MKLPTYLYHGSGRRILGALVPKKANDLDKVKENSLNGVYASSVKEQALSMALHSCKGVREGSLGMHKVNDELKIRDSVIYRGWPKQKYIYLYTILSNSFVNRPRGSSQWISFRAVRPFKIEKLLVKDYIHLVRKATNKEKAIFFKEQSEV
ncbi:MAG: hypothetical protein AABW79_01325 [Nanoarchaeota archaeon]